MTYRPDEIANISTIQSDLESRRKVKSGLGTAASLGLGLTYGKAAQKILPYLSGGIPIDMAMKAIQKFSPKIADFIKRGQNMGLPVEEGLEFVKEHLGKKTEGKPSLFRRLAGDVDVTNLDEKATKELSFLENIASKLEGEGKDEKHPTVKKLKKKIEKVLKGLTGMVESEAMGMEPMQGQPPIQQGQPPIQQQQQQQQMQQAGPGQQALMAILQKIQASRGM